MGNKKLKPDKIISKAYWNYTLHLDLYLEIDIRGRLIFFYNKRNGFIFPTLVVNFPFMISNIPVALAYGVHISKLVCYFMD